jgi:predicted ATPase
VAIASEHGFPLWAAYGWILQGWADAQKGEATTGIARIRDGLAAAEATGARVLAPFCLALQAEALALAGKIERKPLPPWTMHWQKRPSPASVPGTQKFIACAASSPVACHIPIRRRPRSRSALPWRSPASRARGATNCAPPRASPLYGWFTEGFDTADLKEAKRLLDQLA